jgi:hypothetical protein
VGLAGFGTKLQIQLWKSPKNLVGLVRQGQALIEIDGAQGTKCALVCLQGGAQNLGEGAKRVKDKMVQAMERMIFL